MELCDETPGGAWLIKKAQYLDDFARRQIVYGGKAKRCFC